MNVRKSSGSRAARPVGADLATALGGLCAMASAMGIGRFVYTPILPFMVSDRGLSGSAAGLVASANFLGYLLGAMAAATPRLKGPRHAWLLGALAASAATTLLMGASAELAAWVVLRFAGGVASAFVLVFASTMVLDRVRQSGRPGLAAIHFGGVGTGIVLSSLVVSLGAAAGLGWRGLWVASGLLACAGLLATFGLVKDEGESSGPPPAAVRSRPGKAATLLVTAYGLFGFGYVVTATFLVLMVRGAPQARGLEPLVWPILGAAAIPSVALWNAVGVRLGPARAYAAAALVEAVGVGAGAAWPSVPGLLLAAILLGGTFMGLTALGIAAARALSPADPRPITAVMTAAFGLGQMVGPTLAGYVVDHTGSFALANGLACAALVASAALAAAVSRAASSARTT